jgi:hypothetical protein
MIRICNLLVATVGIIAACSTAAMAEEHLMWDLNRPVTKADNGFPWSYSPPNNTNWKSPVDYYNGMVQYRMEIKSCAGSGQDVCIQLCFHQDNLSKEACGSGKSFKTFTSGEPIIITWSQKLSSWWNKSGGAIDWTRARQRVMLAIKKGTGTGGTPISNICCGWNWAGLDPDQIYPIDMRFTAVGVSNGGTFSGWSNWTGDTHAAISPAANRPQTFRLARSSDGRATLEPSGADLIQWKFVDQQGRTVLCGAGKELPAEKSFPSGIYLFTAGLSDNRSVQCIVPVAP